LEGKKKRDALTEKKVYRRGPKPPECTKAGGIRESKEKGWFLGRKGSFERLTIVVDKGQLRKRGGELSSNPSVVKRTRTK